jgi:hypothetical protein
MNTRQKNIVTTLRKIGSGKCLEKANEIEHTSSLKILHLRNLELTSSDVILLANALNHAASDNAPLIESISFSYNFSLGDEGAISLSKNLPTSIREIGLVNCGINDQGGLALLNWMRNAPQLRMACIEGNNFSQKIKKSLQKFRTQHPHILLVFD